MAAASGVSALLPYAVNFSAVVLIVTVVAKKPLRKFVFQRHERIKDFVESSALAHRRAAERAEAAKRATAQLAAEAQKIKQADLDSAGREAAEILAGAEKEAARVRRDAERMMAVEAAEMEEKIRSRFLDQVISRVETKLQSGLRTDDHAKIVRRARSSIEVGV